MELVTPGHPIHTRALSVTVTQADAEHVAAVGSILDLRKRGFCPVGSELQGMGIIHQMELRLLVDTGSGSVERIAALQPTVAFEASAATLGECCRDPIDQLVALEGAGLGDHFLRQLRELIGGRLGCSHIVTLAQLVNATVPWALQQERSIHTDATRRGGEVVFRRDLILDGHEVSDSTLAIALQLSDLHTAATPPVALAPDRFARHYEARVALQLDGWPATVTSLAGAQRTRHRRGFADAVWEDLTSQLHPLRATVLAKGATAAIATALSDTPPIRDALLMVGPALIQCRASFPDKWLARALDAAGHPGLIAMADSCYMWRRGGGLEQVRTRTRERSG